VSFVKTTGATYPVTIHCTLDSHFYGHRSSILESFTICVADTEKVICNSKYVRAIAKKSGNNYSIYVTRIDYPSKRNNSNSNNVTINYIESESPIKIQGFDDSNAIEMNSINSCGTTAQRPTLQSYDNNFEYYDSNLEEVIHWDGTHWLNSNKVVAGTPTSGMFYYKPTTSANLIPIGFKYFCTDKKTAEGSENGVEIIHKGNDVWVDALGRVIS
jgi:hypothetical protein